MAKNLFLVHGMGVAKPGWSAGAQKALATAAGNYAAFKGTSLFSNLKFTEITYDTVFRSYVDKWDAQAKSLDDFAKAGNFKLPVDLSGYLKGCSDTEKQFFWSHIVDVLLYRFAPDVTNEVRASVLKQFTAALGPIQKDGADAEASVLAHSLGTSVAHDSMAMLGSQAIDGSKGYNTGNFKFKNVFMLANVSKILKTDVDPEDASKSVVHPDSAGPNAYCSSFRNFRHALDPIPMIEPFGPGNWGEDLRSVTDLDHLYDIEGWDAFMNVHGLEHYLVHPKVHIAVLNGIFGGVIPKAEADAAIKNFPPLALGGKLKDKGDALVAALKQIKSDVEAGPKDPGTLIKAGIRFLSEASKFYA